MPPSPIARYARQTRFAPLGEEGQRRLLASRVLLCGCGALGTVIANTLVRAGVGQLRIVDRDFVELTNLQRQVLFDEDDLRDELPKAIAAARKLARINSSVTVEPIVADMNSGNILALCAGVDCILDGTDNFETRFLLNDAACKLNIPWIYGGCIGSEGQILTILPGETACLRCVLPEPPPPGISPTCDMAGVLGPAAGVVASLQAAEAIKLLSGHRDDVCHDWRIFDLWENTWRAVKLDRFRETGGCETCGRHEYPWLSGQRGSQAAILCGRNAVQFMPDHPPLPLDELRAQLQNVGQLSGNAYLLRLAVESFVLTLFPDGRAIISGTDDIGAAKSVYAKYVGN